MTMPDYKVFNPECEEAKNGRIGPDTPIERLDEQTQSWIEDKVRECLISNNPLVGRWPTTISVFEDNVRQLLRGTIDELDGIVSVENVLDEWAINNSFDPREVQISHAGWIAFDSVGRQMAFEANLLRNTASPNGQSWEINAFAWAPNKKMWFKNLYGTTSWKFEYVYDIEGTLPLPPDLPDKHWSLIRAPYPFLDDELNIWGDDAQPQRKATSQEIEELVASTEYFAIEKTKLPDPLHMEIGRFPNEVDALRDELEELKVALAEYEASEIRSENLLVERDKEIESLRERLSAYEDVQPVRLSDLAEKPEFVSRLSLADFTHEKKTIVTFHGQEAIDTYEYSDERLFAYIEEAPTDWEWEPNTGWAWELKANGTTQMGLADSPVEAVSKVKEAYGHLTAPPPTSERAQTTYPNPDMFEAIDANTWRYESEAYGVEIKHELNTADYVVKVSTDTGVTTKIESTFQDAYATGFKETEKLGVNLSGVEANPGQTDTGRAVPLKEAMARGVEPPAPFPAEPSLEALSAMAPKGPVR